MAKAIKKIDRKLCTVSQYFNTHESKRANLMPIAINDLGIQKRAGARAIDEEARTVSMVWSTATVDSMGDIIEPKGWDLKRYKRNSVICLNHETYNLPIGRGHDVTKSADALTGDVEFMPEDVYPLAETVWQMVKGEWLKTGSVGFMPIEWEAMYDETSGYFKGYRFVKQSLYEFSIVTVPANPDAMVSAKAAGINLRPLRDDYSKHMDVWETSALGLLVPRARVEAAWKAAGETFVRGATMEDDSNDDNSSDGSGAPEGGDDEREGEERSHDDHPVVGHNHRGAAACRDGDVEALADVRRADVTGRSADGSASDDRDASVADESGSSEGGSESVGPGDDVQPGARADRNEGRGHVEDIDAESRAAADEEDKGESEKASSSELVQKNVRREVSGVVHVFDARSGAYIGHVDKSGRLSVDKRAQDRVADANIDAINADHRARIEARRSISSGIAVVANSRKRAEMAIRRHSLH